MSNVAVFYKKPSDILWSPVLATPNLSVSETSIINNKVSELNALFTPSDAGDPAQTIMHNIYKKTGPLTVGINQFQMKLIKYNLLGPEIDPIGEILVNHNVRVHDWGQGYMQINPSI